MLSNMKFELTITSLWLATIQAVAIPEPQLGGATGGLKFVGQKEGKPRYRQNAKRVTLRYGPLTVVGKDVSIPIKSASMHC